MFAKLITNQKMNKIKEAIFKLLHQKFNNNIAQLRLAAPQNSSQGITPSSGIRLHTAIFSSYGSLNPDEGIK